MGRSKLTADGIKAYRADGTRVPGYCRPLDPDEAAEREQKREDEENTTEEETDIHEEDV